eukprot:scaffold32956_cov17-Tisochrysis_lutea.AAC.1
MHNYTKPKRGKLFSGHPHKPADCCQLKEGGFSTFVNICHTIPLRPIQAPAAATVSALFSTQPQSALEL